MQFNPHNANTFVKANLNSRPIRTVIISPGAW
jgi:hypothetical protein